MITHEQVSDESLKKCGQYFDLDDTTRLYEVAGKGVHWTDTKYYIDDENWDVDAYYDDFENWWNGLTNEQRRNYFDLM